METLQILHLGVLFEPGVEPPRLFHCCRPLNGLPAIFGEIDVIGPGDRDCFAALACTNPSCSGLPGLGLSLREFVHLRHEVEELRMISVTTCTFALAELTLEFSRIEARDRREPEVHDSWKRFVQTLGERKVRTLVPGNHIRALSGLHIRA